MTETKITKIPMPPFAVIGFDLEKKEEERKKERKKKNGGEEKKLITSLSTNE